MVLDRIEYFKEYYKRPNVRERRIKYYRIWRIKNEKRIKDYYKRNYQKIKLNVLKLIGKGKIECNKCGCADTRILEVNHKSGGGHKELTSYKSNSQMYRNIAKGKRNIDDLNILCRVCNSADFVERKFDIKFKIMPIVSS